jgi:hypothetical protein
MPDREREREVDQLVARFLTALEDGDFDTVELLWSAASSDPELEVALTDAAVELAADYDRAAGQRAETLLEATVRTSMPAAEVAQPPDRPLTTSDVAEHIRRSGAPGLSAADLGLNDFLARSQDPVPEHLGLSAVVAWGAKYGIAPEAYWKVFRQAALTLRLRRESAAEYQLAARPSRPKPAGGAR